MNLLFVVNNIIGKIVKDFFEPYGHNVDSLTFGNNEIDEQKINYQMAWADAVFCFFNEDLDKLCHMSIYRRKAKVVLLPKDNKIIDFFCFLFKNLKRVLFIKFYIFQTN
jgi:hypothetical protein